MNKYEKCLNRVFDFMSENATHWKNDKEILSEAIKKAEAFDILVKHCLIIVKNEELLLGYSLQVENNGSHLLGEEISKEEFELLKEVLGNDK